MSKFPVQRSANTHDTVEKRAKQPPQTAENPRQNTSQKGHCDTAQRTAVQQKSQHAAHDIIAAEFSGARSPHFGVGIRLVAHTNHGFDRRCSLPARTISGGDPGASGREPAQPLSARTGRNHAHREGMADPRSRGNPAPIRFHAPAAGIVRIHRHERPERLSASHPRAMPPAGRHQVPDQPDPFP